LTLDDTDAQAAFEDFLTLKRDAGLLRDDDVALILLQPDGAGNDRNPHTETDEG
jgi:hypothetical protein